MCDEAIEDADKRQVAPQSRGRHRFFNAQELMAVWLFVQVGARRAGLSVNKFCATQEIAWIEAGHYLAPKAARPKTGRLVVSRTARRGTLRRRYYEAVQFLAEESAPYMRLKELGFTSRRFGDRSPTEEFWRAELERRLTA